MNSVVALLQALIQIPSVNPEGNPTVSPNGEKNVAQFIADFLQPLGYTLTFEEVQPGRPNLIARAPGPGGRPRILLGPHLDTVGIEGMSIDPFEAEIREGKIYGRGSSDTKGPMAAMLWALKEKASTLASLPIAVDFVAFAGEEAHQPGSKHFAQHHSAEYEFAIVGEPTSLEAVYCTKGNLWAVLKSRGKSVHSSQPELGENAILKLLEGLRNLHGPFLERLRSTSHPVLGSSTMNLGTIAGGTVTNVVPSQATASIDIRSVPALIAEKTAAEVLREHLGDLELLNFSESPPMEMERDHPWLKKLQKIDQNLTLTGAAWFSDAAHLSAAGLPSICLGPGSIDQAHTADEFIKISDLEAGSRWFEQLISGLAT